MDHIWKKYSRSRIFHRSLREDIMDIFSIGGRSEDLEANEFWALQEISLSVSQGEIVGFSGPNGAGKSTIFKLIANITNPTLGSVTALGQVAPFIEIGAGFHQDLSGRENIFINGAILGMMIATIKKKIDSIIAFSELEEFIDMPVKKYSSGMYIRLAFSVAIHSEADIFLVDEIITVGDSSFQEKCLEKIRQLKKQNKTILITSHKTSLLESLSDRIFKIEKGEMNTS